MHRNETAENLNRCQGSLILAGTMLDFITRLSGDGQHNLKKLLKMIVDKMNVLKHIFTRDINKHIYQKNKKTCRE